MMASISKLLTATAIMQLNEQGALHLDQPITDILPELHQRTKLVDHDPTIRSVLSHHSGLQSDLFAEQLLNEVELDHAWYRHYRRLLDQPELIHQVNTSYEVQSYSNLAYSLMALVIERTSGESFESYMQTKIFEPLAMHSATFSPNVDNSSYAKGFDGNEIAVLKTRDIAAGGLLASSAELAHFAQMVLHQGRFDDQTLLSPSSLLAMAQAQNLDVSWDGGTQMGLGYWLDSAGLLDASLTTLSHGGDEAPFHSYLLVVPELDKAVVISTNSGGDSMDLAILAEQLLLVLHPEAVTTQIAPTHLASTQPKIDHTIDGFYSLPFGYAKLTYQDDQHIDLDAGLFRAKLTPDEQGMWQLAFRMWGWLPLPVEDIQKMRIAFDQNGQAWLYIHQTNVGPMIKVEPQSIDEQWTTREGKYKLVTGHSQYDELIVYQKDGQLLAGPNFGFDFTMAYPVQVYSDSQLILTGKGRNLGEVLTWQDEQTLVYSGAVYSKK